MSKNSKFFRVVYYTDPNCSEYRFPFKIFTEKGLRVSVLDPGDLEQVPMILGGDYTVEGVGEADGGKIILTLRGVHKAEEGLKLVIKKGVAHQDIGASGNGGTGGATPPPPPTEPEECSCECSVPLWNPEKDYTLPSLVYGSDHYLYEAVEATGPNSTPGPKDPTLEETEGTGAVSPWTTFELPESSGWINVVCSPTTGRFVALGGLWDASNVCAWSDDGINWTKCNLPSSQYWRGLHCNKDGIFIVSATGNSTATPSARSVDGINWVSINTPTPDGLYTVTSNPQGMFIGGSSCNTCWSNDGITWNLASMPKREAFWRWIACNSKGQCVALGQNFNPPNTHIAAYSPDGKTWQASTLPSSGSWGGPVVNNQGRFFLVKSGTNTGAYSDDGLNWHQVTLPKQFTGSAPGWCLLPTREDGAFMIWGSNSSDEPVQYIGYSYDAINWVELPPLPQSPLVTDIRSCFGPQGELLVVPTQPNTSKTGFILRDFNYSSLAEPAYWQRLDTNPVGTCLTRASRNVPVNYVPLDGALLERAKYPQLWKAAEKSGLIVAEANWSAAQSGYSSGDGSTTFRIPKKDALSSGWVECLKVR